VLKNFKQVLLTPLSTAKANRSYISHDFTAYLWLGDADISTNGTFYQSFPSYIWQGLPTLEVKSTGN